jgi:hypothetical protein
MYGFLVTNFCGLAERFTHCGDRENARVDGGCDMRIAMVMLAGGLMLAPAAMAQHGQHGAPQQGQTLSLQGDTKAWSDNAHMHAFFDLTKARLGAGAGPLDFERYRDEAYAIFRAFGTSMGMDPEGMVDHLKDIPRQLVGIVKDDPKVLDSYANFRVALMGPE